jgi:hypothetical protein
VLVMTPEDAPLIKSFRTAMAEGRRSPLPSNPAPRGWGWAALMRFDLAAAREPKTKTKAKTQWLQTCEGCGRKFHADRKDQRFHDGACRQAAYRARVTARHATPGKDTGVGPNREYTPMNPGAVDPRNVTPCPTSGASGDDDEGGQQ